MRIYTVGKETDFVHMGLADQHGTSSSESGDDNRIGLGWLAPEKTSSTSSGIRDHIDFIFDGYRHTVKWPKIPAFFVTLSGLLGLPREVVRFACDEGPERRLDFLAAPDGS
jgi:hypothetical protein